MIFLQPHIDDCLLWHDQRASAKFKQQASDFIVDEGLTWAFRGHGEHLFLRIEKTDCNTVWVAKQLAKFYGVPPRDIGYSGLKDRHAVTTQYFSVRLPGVKPGAYQLPVHAEFRVLSHDLHDKKLKRGNHAFNDFRLRLRAVTGDKSVIAQRLADLADQGCPNFFDSQRFGKDNSNLKRLAQWLNGDINVTKRHEKSLLLSALRAAEFNRQLGQRVQNRTWQTLVPGDVAILDGSNSHFSVASVDAELSARAAANDIHPAGVLPGADDSIAGAPPPLAELMQRERLQRAYRSLRLRIQQLAWQFAADDLILTMRLPRGAYASGVIRHIFNLQSD